MKTIAILKTIPKAILLPYLSNKYCPVNRRVYTYKYGYKLSINKSALVYYIKFILPSGLIVYKIGYTSLSLAKRIEYMKLPLDIKVIPIATYRAKTIKLAYVLEQYLHSLYQKSRYRGLPFLASGNTELYINNPLSL